MEPSPALQSLEIRGLSADSRKIGPGDLFAALPGTVSDGRRFIDDAVAQGAAAVLTPPGTTLKDYGRPLAQLIDENPRRRLALMAARFYGRQPKTIAAVTGTNGKTSVAEFTRQIWQAEGLKAATLGTLGLVPAQPGAPASLTTPDPVDLHRCLAALAGDGFDHLAMEASSHGLDQYRLDGVAVGAAAFTNLSRDHLDYHGDTAAYLAAKRRLFAELVAPGGSAVLNADVPEFEMLRATVLDRGLKLITYGQGGSELRLAARSPAPAGQELEIEVFGKRHEVELPLAGGFQAANALAALGLAIATGSDPEAAVMALGRLTGVPGRLELVARSSRGGLIFVDYAHTPDALASLLAALRPHTKGRLVAVFGCGGDRDRGKRPIMGEIAGRLADLAIVTDDNPRGEDPTAIRQEILTAIPGAREIGDRMQAIEAGIALLGPGDTLVVAGKGHEPGQIVGDKVLPFDDREAVRAAVARASEDET